MRPKSSWTPPDDWQRLETFELHTAGKPLRVFTKGLPPIEGDTILEKLLAETESILGTTMEVSVAGRVRFGSYEAVVPEVTGTAYYGSERALVRPGGSSCKGVSLEVRR